MKRLHDIKISFDPTRFSQVFIHTSGSYLKELINPNNNYYLKNVFHTPSQDELHAMIKKIDKAKSEKEKNKLIKEFTNILETNKDIQASPLSFNDDISSLDGYIVFETESAIEHYDLSILDFISYDFNNLNHYLLFFINFFDYFIDVLSDKDLKYLERDVMRPVNEVVEIAKKYYDKEKDNLIAYQNIFKKCIDFIYEIEKVTDFSKLNYRQRFILFNQIYKEPFKKFSSDFHTTGLLNYNYPSLPYDKQYVDLDNVDIVINLLQNMDPDGKLVSSSNQFITDNIFTSFYISLFNIIAIDNMYIKVCKNCKRYFITPKSNIVYCDREWEDGLTCKDIGNKLSQKRKQQEEYVYGKYRSIYAKKAMNAKRNPDLKKYIDEYEEWKAIAKQFRNDIKAGKKTYEEFEKWLDENK